MIYKYGVLGGTFDRLHSGHKSLLVKAFMQSEKVAIGLATQKLFGRKFLSRLIQSYSERQKELVEFLKEKNFYSRARIIKLDDIYGTTLKERNFEAIFVTEATILNALIINNERVKLGFSQMEIVKIPFKKDQTGEIITSERIRLGEIDRQGRVYMKIFRDKSVLALPVQMRQQMRRPIGSVLNNINGIKRLLPQGSLLISVGDIVTKSLYEINCLPDIAIVDFKTRRHALNLEIVKKINSSKSRVVRRNDAGTINSEAVREISLAVHRALTKKHRQTLVIEGEEDLLALPVILIAPLNSLTCYGNFDLNAVMAVKSSEENKKLIYGILKQFD